MNDYNNLSEEEKRALIELCKEDPVIFIETVCNIKLFEYQKKFIHKILNEYKNRDKPDFRRELLGKPVYSKEENYD